jgi:hypothetical protein
MLQMLFSLDDFLKSSHQQSNVKICSAARRTICNIISLAPIQALAPNAGNVHQGQATSWKYGPIEYDDDHNYTLIMLSIVGIVRSCLVHWFYT